MRTTLTIEPDVADRLKRKMAEQNLTLKQAVNTFLRRGLDAPEPKTTKFKVKPFGLGGFMPGVDPARLNQLADELETEEYIRKLKLYDRPGR